MRTKMRRFSTFSMSGGVKYFHTSAAKDRGDAIVAYIRNHNLLEGEFKRLSGVELLSPADTRFGTTVIELDRLNDFKTDVSLTFHGEKVCNSRYHLIHAIN